MWSTHNIQEMVNNGEPIYVINRSVQVTGKELLLILSFPHPTGSRGSTVQLPCIKYPVNLTRMVAPPSAIPLCVEFVEWVNRGIIEIVPAEEAEPILKDPEVRALIDAAYKKLKIRRGEGLGAKPKFNVRHGGSRETHGIADLDDAGLTTSDFERSLVSTGGMEPVKPAPLTVSAEVIKIRPKITNFCEDLLADPSLKGDYLVTLKGWDESIFSEDELSYMLQTLSKFENICTYLRSIKAKRVNIVDDDDVTPRRQQKRGKKIKDLEAFVALDDDEL